MNNPEDKITVIHDNKFEEVIPHLKNPYLKPPKIYILALIIVIIAIGIFLVVTRSLDKSNQTTPSTTKPDVPASKSEHTTPTPIIFPAGEAEKPGQASGSSTTPMSVKPAEVKREE